MAISQGAPRLTQPTPSQSERMTWLLLSASSRLVGTLAQMAAVGNPGTEFFGRPATAHDMDQYGMCAVRCVLHYPIDPTCPIVHS